MFIKHILYNIEKMNSLVFNNFASQYTILLKKEMRLKITLKSCFQQKESFEITGDIK